MSFSIEKFTDVKTKTNRFELQLNRLRNNGRTTKHIRETVGQAVSNLNRSDSFVIYGDPQSGKTEMMIALTAKLLDEGNKTIVVLLNDNVGLLEQNLTRFSKAELDPAPHNYKAILDKQIGGNNNEWIIFCKKKKHLRS